MDDEGKNYEEKYKKQHFLLHILTHVHMIQSARVIQFGGLLI